MAEDSIFTDSPKSKEKNAKLGRRAKKEKCHAIDSSIVFDDDSDMTLTKEIAHVNADAPPKPKKSIGGWGDDKRSKHVAEAEEDERFRPQTPKDDSDDDIPVIPELEDQTEVSNEVEVAIAPNIVVNRVATFKELDSDLVKHASFLTLDDDIDMKILCQSLSSEQEVNEADENWDWERLFTEVSSELLSEWDIEENNLKNSLS